MNAVKIIKCSRTRYDETAPDWIENINAENFPLLQGKGRLWWKLSWTSSLSSLRISLLSWKKSASTQCSQKSNAADITLSLTSSKNDFPRYVWMLLEIFLRIRNDYLYVTTRNTHNLIPDSTFLFHYRIAFLRIKTGWGEHKDACSRFGKGFLGSRRGTLIHLHRENVRTLS